MTQIPVQPIIVTPLFPELRAVLLDVVSKLSAEQWAMPTACAGWSVKDVALHILGDDVGNLSRRRDGFSERSDFAGWDDLVRWINYRNELWVEMARRLSRRLLGEMLQLTGKMVNDYLASLDPYALGGPVSWAGSDPAPVWLDLAREYTEYWMHHQHICEAVGMTSMKDRRHFHPVLDTFVRALPHTYRHTIASPGTVISLILTGEAGDAWHLLREDDQWALYAETDMASACTVTMPTEVAWKLFTNGMEVEQVRKQATIAGDPTLAEPVLQMVSIIA